jgi:hypothetical protein
MRRLAVLAGLAALALVSGCGGTDDAPPPAASSPSESTTSPTADVASGLRLTKPDATVVAPEGWTKGRALVSDEVAADSPDGLSYLTLAEIEAFGSTQGAEELGHTRVESSLFKTPPKLLPVTELDGVPVYHVAGFVTADRYLEEFGAIRNDRIVTLAFSFNEKVPAAERAQVVEQVLPTFEWR